MGQRSGCGRAGQGRMAALRRSGAARGVASAAALGVSLGGCGAASGVHDFFLGGGSGATQQALTGFIGGAAADEPQAALAARAVLAQGGTAADAAVALAFTLSVTLPSRASLGAGGACVAYQPRESGAGGGVPQAIMFTPIAPAAPGAGADRPAAVPMMARGMFLLHALYGSRPFESLVAPAEQLARFGTPVSRAFAQDLAEVGGPLLADPNARAVFGAGGAAAVAADGVADGAAGGVAARARPGRRGAVGAGAGGGLAAAGGGGATLAEGAVMTQPALGATLAQLRVAGVGDFYQGGLAAKLVHGAAVAGGGLAATDLRTALPHAVAPLVVAAGTDQVAFVPEPADGGVAAAAGFQALLRSPEDMAGAQARAVAAAAAVRAGADAKAALAGGGGGAALPALPASTSFVVIDRHGEAVACALTMDNLFGTGRVAAGTGVLLAASPALARPMLAAAVEWNANLHAFRAAAGGSGQEGAALAVAAGLEDARRSGRAMAAPVPEPGRANVASCARYLPGTEESCHVATDPRGAGLAVGSE
ncbi:MAG: gamma-glutamyltransferase [Janthinobacterium lividum]